MLQILRNSKIYEYKQQLQTDKRTFQLSPVYVWPYSAVGPLPELALPVSATCYAVHSSNRALGTLSTASLELVKHWAQSVLVIYAVQHSHATLVLVLLEHAAFVAQRYLAYLPLSSDFS
jgi:hypothetical protein